MLGQFIEQVMAVLPQFLVGLGAFPAVYGVFAWVEERTSAEAKRDIALWLKGFGGLTIATSVSLNVRQFHRKLFGSRQLSIRCLSGTIIFSLVSFVVIMAPYVSALIYAYTEQPEIIREATGMSPSQVLYASLISILLIFVGAILPLNYIGVGITRFFIELFHRNINLIKGFILLLCDIMFKFSMLPLLLYTMFGITWVINHGTHIGPFEWVEFILNLKIVTDFSGGKNASYLLGMWLWLSGPMILCSMWVWIYFFGLHALKKLHVFGLRTMKVLVWFLDIEKQPIRSVGVVAAGAITLVYALAAHALGAK